jgi:tRNA (cytosine49-C5)-methyltransferase
MDFKNNFIEKYSKLTDFKEYKKSVETFAPRSIRINTLKSSIEQEKGLLKEYKLSNVPWCKEGFFINKKVSGLGHLDSHWSGNFFIQSSVSMIPPLVLNPSKDDIVLDMTAAPGAKTTQLAAIMKNKGIILANDSKLSRAKTLISNLERCGVKNTVVNYDDALKLTGNFDKILLDAPCSGSGNIKGPSTITKKTLKTWNPNMIKRLANLQRRLILHAYSLLKPKGTLVYSTCSLEPEEDEDVINYLLSKTSAKLLKIDLPVKSENKKYFKIWPQYQNTEGFFIAKIRK